MRRLFIVAIVSSVVILGLVSTAYAYHTDEREGDYTCADCHGDDRGDWTGKGPHGYYNVATRKCRLCHTVHHANDQAILLLATSTVSDSCLTCHDSTGAVGVYSSITARGGVVASEHSIGATTAVPGGSTDLSRVLECHSCHTVHDATQLAGFLGETDQADPGDGGLLFASNNLLRDDVNGAARGTYTVYGGAWCAACHDERPSGGSTHNHPTTQTVPYEILTDPDPYAATNEAFSMTPVGTAPRQDPYCQQCHEDSRDAESPWEADMKEDGLFPEPVNPAYVVFPHQSTNANLLVETDDDLCTNCHPTSALP